MANEIDAMGSKKKDVISASSFAVAESVKDVTGSFNDRSITFNGSLANYDYTQILRDKQGNINKLYELADFFVDSEELIGSAVHQIFVPFSLTDGWYLTSGTDQTRAKYMEYFERIHLNEKLESWFYQYYLFANVYFSLMEDGDVVTLPPHLCRISNVLVNGNPLVEFYVQSIKNDFKQNGQKAWKKFIDDDKLEIRVGGYPKEVNEALRTNRQYVQLDPKTTFLLQAGKPEWQRYAIPMIARCLIPLAEKALLRDFLDALLGLGAASFVHASVASPRDSNIIVDRPILQAVLDTTKNAMKAGNGVSVTNDGVSYSIIQPKLDEVFKEDIYRNVNESILGALGINNSVSSGTDASISFGSSQISTRVISLRISAARQNMSKLINRLIRAVNGSPYGLPRSNESKLPVFNFPTCDLTQVAAFKNECMKLWESGVLSTKTLLDNYHVNIETEYELKKQEIDNGMTEVFVKPGTNVYEETDNNDTGDGKKVGRPTLPDEERNSSPDNSDSGRLPKPSNEDGSEAQE